MTESEVDLASLLCSRLCHDLLSPVGAMNNGLELLADEHDPEMRKRCMDLLAESAKSAADKLKFFRLAFGAAGGFGSEVDVTLFAEASSGLLDRTDLDEAAVALEPGRSGAILVYENCWAAPFATALRRQGAQLVASGRIPVQGVLSALDALDAST